jgi:hypothetical protein
VRYLSEGHLGDNGKHDLLALGRVRVLDVLEQPRLEGACRLACGVLPSNVQSTIAATPPPTLQCCSKWNYDKSF